MIADQRTGAGEQLDIQAMMAAPEVTPADWSAVTSRRASRANEEGDPDRLILVATPTPTGFVASGPLPVGLVLRAFGDGDDPLGSAVVSGPTTLEAAEEVRDGARYLDAEDSGCHVLVHIHQTEDIAKNLGGDTRKALRQALGALEEDPSQLEALLKLTEKVIFDSDDIVKATPQRPVSTPAPESPAAPAPTSLALDAGGRKSARRKRSLASGDIVVLLDALMRRLGEGLHSPGPPRPRNDQDEIGADEEDGGEPIHEPPDFEVLAKACRGKARRLIKRMEAQLEQASAPDRARRGIIQLAAVLGVVRTLRLIGQRPEWKRRQLELVEQGDERRLFEAAVLAVTWGEEALLPRAVTEAGGEWFDELSMVTGLLAWLAWTLELDVEEAAQRAGRQGVEDESWYSIQLLAALGPCMEGDEDAFAIWEESVARSPRYKVDGDRWLRNHKALLDAVGHVAATADHHGQAARATRPGDLLVLGRGESPRVRLVLDVRPGRDGSKVVFFDPDGTDNERAFLNARVATLPWQPAATSTAVSA